MTTQFIFGRHAVLALLKSAPERIQVLFLSTGTEHEFKPLAHKHGIRIEEMNRKLAQELGGAVHQGIVARVATSGLVQDYAEFMSKLETTASTALVLLNKITDPHNVGAIIRSAAAFGAAAVLLPAYNQAPITGAVAKASAGMVFTIPIVGIGNENQTILDLKTRKFWVYGLDAEGKNELSKEKFDAPAVFVIGSEAEGMRQKTREHCDILLRVPMHSRAESLNASVSAGVVLSHWSAQHPEALR